MRRVHIIGRKNSGKTTLITELVRYLSARGYRVGTIKHTHHQHELDTPGKDSHRHREAGAAPVGIIARNMTAVFCPATEGEPKEERYRRMAPLFAGCDVVLVEGDLQTDQPKMEVWRAATGNEPVACSDSSVRYLITDDEPPPCATPRLPRSELSAVAHAVLELAGLNIRTD